MLEAPDTGTQQMSLLSLGRAEMQLAELQVRKYHLDPCKSNGVNNPGNHLQTYERQEGKWELPEWTQNTSAMR